jgi:predicted transcriptional regulator
MTTLRTALYYAGSESVTIRPMPDDSRVLRGENQIELMKAVWRTGGGTVEEIRAAMPADYASAYTTTQTMLNRLAERGLLARTPGRTSRGPGGKIVYTALITEEEYLAESIERTLAGASPEARRAAIAQLIGRVFEVDKAPSRKGRRGGRGRK